MNKKPSEFFFRTKSLDEYIKSENKNEFVYKELVTDSNLIEGIYLEGQIFHTGDIEDFLASDHIKAYKHVIDNYHQPLTAEKILNLHLILMNNIFRLQIRGAAGEYRKNAVYIRSKSGSQEGGMHYKLISKAMSILEQDITNLNPENIQTNDIIKIHNDFEIIHPFNDGNGRTGRLILNWLSLKYLNEFIIIDVNKKKNYYENINSRRKIYTAEHPEMKFYRDAPAKKSPIDPWLLESPFNHKS